MTGKEMIKLFKQNGWQHIRTTGSHYIMSKEGIIEPIPVHSNKDLKKGLQSHLLKRIQEVK